MRKYCECRDYRRTLVAAHSREVNQGAVVATGKDVLQADRCGSIGNANSDERVRHQNWHPSLFIITVPKPTAVRAPKGGPSARPSAAPMPLPTDHSRPHPPDEASAPKRATISSRSTWERCQRFRHPKTSEPRSTTRHRVHLS